MANPFEWSLNTIIGKKDVLNHPSGVFGPPLVTCVKPAKNGGNEIGDPDSYCPGFCTA
jgi:hypothetical protein